MMHSAAKKIFCATLVILGIITIALIAYKKYRQSHFVYTPDPNAIPRDHLFTLEEAENFLFEIATSRKKLNRALKNLAEQRIERGALLPIAYAVGQNDIVKSLVASGADINAHGISKKYTPPILVYAVSSNDIPMATYLLEHGAHIDIKDATGEPLIFTGILAGLEMTKFLITHGTDIKAVDSLGRTTLHEAAHIGNSDIVKLCLESGITVDAKDGIGRTPLYDATYPWPRKKPDDRMEITKLLIAKNAHANETDNYGITPLHEAARYRCNDIISLLLEHGAKLDAEDNEGITPLFMAAFSSNIEGLQLLLEKGANLDHKTKNGATVLHFAGTPEIAEFLIKHNINDVNIRDTNGMTPLHYAAGCTCIDQYSHIYVKKGRDYRALGGIIKYLINAGADVNAEDNNGIRPLDCAEANEDLVTTKILKEHKAQRSQKTYKKACK